MSRTFHARPNRATSADDKLPKIPRRRPRRTATRQAFISAHVAGRI